MCREPELAPRPCFYRYGFFRLIAGFNGTFTPFIFVASFINERHPTGPNHYPLVFVSLESNSLSITNVLRIFRISKPSGNKIVCIFEALGVHWCTLRKLWSCRSAVYSLCRFYSVLTSFLDTTSLASTVSATAVQLKEPQQTRTPELNTLRDWSRWRDCYRVQLLGLLNSASRTCKPGQLARKAAPSNSYRGHNPSGYATQSVRHSWTGCHQSDMATCFRNDYVVFIPGD